jgi:hypothetical protein
VSGAARDRALAKWEQPRPETLEPGSRRIDMQAQTKAVEITHVITIVVEVDGQKRPSSSTPLG